MLNKINPEDLKINPTQDISTDSDSERVMSPIYDSDDTGYKVENHGSSEEDAAVDGELGNLETPSSHAVFYPKGFRCCKQLAGVPSHTILESQGKDPPAILLWNLSMYPIQRTKHVKGREICPSLLRPGINLYFG